MGIKQNTNTYEYSHTINLDSKIAIVVSRFNDSTTSILLEKTLSIFTNYSIKDVKVFWAPGSFEIPIICKKILENYPSIRGIVTLGCILAGETKQNEYIANSVIYHIHSLSIQYSIPITLGIITPKNNQQAFVRSMGSKNYISRGVEAAESLLQTLETINAM